MRALVISERHCRRARRVLSRDMSAALNGAHHGAFHMAAAVGRS
jgi:hypothetical protein